MTFKPDWLLAQESRERFRRKVSRFVGALRRRHDAGKSPEDLSVHRAINKRWRHESQRTWAKRSVYQKFYVCRLCEKLVVWDERCRNKACSMVWAEYEEANGLKSCRKRGVHVNQLSSVVLVKLISNSIRRVANESGNGRKRVNHARFDEGDVRSIGSPGA
jgi:hypothetical protein